LKVVAWAAGLFCVGSLYYILQTLKDRFIDADSLASSTVAASLP
jgi:hypothetical protein